MSRSTGEPETGRWLAWISPHDDPLLHAAIEEACLRKSRDRFLLLWINRRSLHAGKNQNLWAQVDAARTHGENVPVFRRLSGGGTVYHDPGNLNFSLVGAGEPKIDFCAHLATIRPFFEKHGIRTEIRNRSDLVHDGGKFSGNAEYFTGGRVLHHGTLLFDADLAAMNHYLTGGTGSYRDRAIDSTRSRTSNLRDFLPAIESTRELASALLEDLRSRHPEIESVAELPGEIREAVPGFRERLARPEWIYGRSPPYELERSSEGHHCRLRVKKGRIASLDFRPSRSGSEAADDPLPARLPGLWHAPAEILRALATVPDLPVDASTRGDYWLDLLFGTGSR